MQGDEDDDRLGQPADDDRRPWFAPKRFGAGYRPQTWQGYLVGAVVALLVILIATIARGNARALGIVPLIVMMIFVRMSGRR